MFLLYIPSLYLYKAHVDMMADSVQSSAQLQAKFLNENVGSMNGSVIKMLHQEEMQGNSLIVDVVRANDRVHSGRSHSDRVSSTSYQIYVKHLQKVQEKGAFKKLNICWILCPQKVDVEDRSPGAKVHQWCSGCKRLGQFPIGY